MALTEKQIEELFHFCGKKFVHHYDLQVELVDHLAERIEEEMAADPKLNFEEALQKVYKGFGIFGFAHIVRQRADMLEKRNNKLWWTEIKSFFILPRILLTLLLGLCFYQLAAFLTAEVAGSVVLVSWLIGWLFEIISLHRLRRTTTKKLMLTQNLPAAMLVTPIIIFQDIIFENKLSIYPIAFAVLMVAGIVFHTAFVVIVKNVTTEAKKLYPEAFKTAS